MNTKQSKAKLRAIEYATLILILFEFAKARKRLQMRIDALLSEIAKRRKTGETIPVAFLFENSRLQSLLSAITAEIALASKAMAEITGKAQQKAVRVAEQQSGASVQYKTGASKRGEPLEMFYRRIAEPATKKIKNVLVTGIAAGLSVAAIKSLIDSAFIAAAAARALTIARTETYSAYKGASIEIFRERRFRYFQWVAEMDETTCEECAALNGTVHEIDEEPFIHPNCRCVVVPVEM